MLIITIAFLQSFISITNQQQYQVEFKLTSFGMKFQYPNISDLYSVQSNVFSTIRCAMTCSVAQECQTFDYDTSSNVCRLFSIWSYQGTIVASTSSTSRVGYVEQTIGLYSLYGKSCNSSSDINRYLLCTSDNLWSCRAQLVYNGSVCQSDVAYSYTTVSYQQECLQNQTMVWNGTSCSPAVVTSLNWNATGITVAGVTGVSGSTPNKLNQPWGLNFDPNGTLYIVDQYNFRVQKWLRGATNGTTVAGQPNSTLGNGPSLLQTPQGVVVDSNRNVYVADTFNHRVQLWPYGASSGIMVAGTGYSGSANNQLHFPRDITRDPTTGTLYISDNWNHRIMRYLVNASSGTVVAGGNGPGTNSTQLNYPMGIYLDVTSNSLYIANYYSNNIVRWVIGATSWTLVAGNINGMSGNSSTMLFSPYDVEIDFMGNIYVTDTSNYRIQFFQAGSMNGTTVAGITGVSGSDAYHFVSPYALKLDSQLNLKNSLISRIRLFFIIIGLDQNYFIKIIKLFNEFEKNVNSLKRIDYLILEQCRYDICVGAPVVLLFALPIIDYSAPLIAIIPPKYLPSTLIMSKQAVSFYNKIYSYYKKIK
ncbi:unnamed protein product [Rotaria socialis]|uniref:Apple domain-containing protein n=2 Tax=Rotaria socialis TaxID=392032 RepID=A0A821I350_9BILA|nr:unnamed protein product [Rotaria socialis]